VTSILAFAAFATGLVMGLAAVGDALHAWSLWRARKVPLRELMTQTGILELRGRARATNPLMAPLTGKTCVQFTVIVERGRPLDHEFGRRPERDEHPDMLTFMGASPFVVDDGSGTVTVDPRVTRVPVTGSVVERKPLPRLTAPLEKMLTARLGKPGGLWCAGREVTATEAALLEGAEVSLVARRTPGTFTPLHVTTGRVRVVALQGFMRAVVVGALAIVLVNVWVWLR
jgi:hypothetical protein